jgi:hypothetical protein
MWTAIGRRTHIFRSFLWLCGKLFVAATQAGPVVAMMQAAEPGHEYDLSTCTGILFCRTTVVANPQPKLFSSLQSLHIARARFRKAMQSGKNVHGVGLTQVANIGLGGIGPNYPLHFCT